MPRRRYDTATLVEDMHRERRHAIFLSMVGFSVLVFLVVYFAFLRESSVPKVPVNEPPPAANAAPTQPKAAKPTAPKEEPATTLPIQPVMAAEALVQVVLPKPAPLFIDGELVAKKAKGHEIKLTPGKHRLAIRLGKKSLQLTLDAEAGAHYRVDADPKKKRLTVEQVTQ